MLSKWTRHHGIHKKFPSFHWDSLWVLMAATSLGLSLVAVVAITLIVYRHADDAINRSIAQNNAQITDNVAASIDSYIKEMVSISDNITDLLSRNSAEEVNNNLLVFLREDIETIAVFDGDGKPVITTDSRPLRDDIEVTRQSWFKGASTNDRNYLISQPHVQRLYRGEYPWVITLTRGVSWEQDGQTHHGTMIVDMNFSRIKDLCSRDLENDGYLYITNQQGNVVYHPKQQMIYAGILPEEITLASNMQEGSSVVPTKDVQLSVCVKPLSNAAWRVIGVSSMDGLATYNSGPENYIVLAILLLVTGVLAGSLILSREMIRPLIHLMELMGRVSNGEETVPAPEGGIYEVGQLGKSFNRMVARIRQLMIQVRKEQEQLHRSELKALNAQMNPHFLYNTLDSVIWLAKCGDEERVIQIVLALSKYFRLSLSGAKDFITVEDELQQVEKYLMIQKMRFGDAFSYQIECEDEVRMAKTPKIMLQPIVENAIVHGIGTIEGGGEITITARRRGDHLELAVHDNGCGIKPSVLEHILETDPRSRSGIGLKNVHQRIRLICGPEYGLKVESELDEGTTVRVCLPLWFEVPRKEEEP
jgi:two-component system, sensor histidine kinase YesM